MVRKKMRAFGTCILAVVALSCGVGYDVDQGGSVALALETASPNDMAGHAAYEPAPTRDEGATRLTTQGNGPIPATGRWKRDECLQSIAKAMRVHKSRVTFPAGAVSVDLLVSVAQQVYSNTEHSFPLLRDTYGFGRFADARYAWDERSDEWCATSVRLVYAQSKKRVSATKREVKRVARQARKRVKKPARIRYVHDYLVRHAAYATVSAQWAKTSREICQSSYGVLCKHRGTCHGYSLAFVRILGAAGVPKAAYCAVCVDGSEAPNHAICKVGKKYYDVTWDDALTQGGRDKGTHAQPSYRYYAKSKRQMHRLGYSWPTWP